MVINIQVFLLCAASHAIVHNLNISFQQGFYNPSLWPLKNQTQQLMVHFCLRILFHPEANKAATVPAPTI